MDVEWFFITFKMKTFVKKSEGDTVCNIFEMSCNT